jgi:hypothetical protein
MHGKLTSVDEQTAREVRAFAKSPDNPFPGRPVPVLPVTGADSRVCGAVPRRVATTSRRRPQARRAARTVSARGDPHQPDDDPSELDQFQAEREAWDTIGLESLGDEPPLDLLDASYPDRVWVAMRLSRTVDACDDLLAGLPVDESRLDPRGLAWAQQQRFVRLDFDAITEWFVLREVAP